MLLLLVINIGVLLGAPPHCEIIFNNCTNCLPGTYANESKYYANNNIRNFPVTSGDIDLILTFDI